jgi:hypothetical protein
MSKSKPGVNVGVARVGMLALPAMMFMHNGPNGNV